MYQKNRITKTTIRWNDSQEGESIEKKMRRILTTREPITDGAPLLYTERSQGVIPETNIRTDRFDLAIEMTDEITKQKVAKRQERHEIPGPGTEDKDSTNAKNKNSPPTDDKGE